MMDMMLWVESAVLLRSVVPCHYLQHMMFRAGSNGTEEKRAFTSYEEIHSPCRSWMNSHQPMLSQPSNIRGAQNSSLGKYVPSRGASPISPILNFGTPFFLPNFSTKLLSITFSLRPEEALLVLTS